MPLPEAPDDLEGWVRARCRREHPGDTRGGRFVLYWCATALRARDNPALAAAMLAAKRLSLPLLVYQGLSARAAWASDRTHRFILESAVDLRNALESRGIRYVFELDDRPRGGPEGGLSALARESALVMTEDFPVGDLRRWRGALARRAGRPVYAVDTACVLPMRLVNKPYERAYAFREATAQARERWYTRAPALDALPAPPAWEGPLPFTETRVTHGSIAAQLAALSIDHSVVRVPSLPGGETAAQARWARYRDDGLARYAATRTDAANPDGASLMSPYLHFGNIAAWRLARDARATLGAAGAEKYLDELMTWRELAWQHCFCRSDYATVSALPLWARQSLAETASRRGVRPSRFAIETGATGDAFYDLCQRGLVRHGVLHNNARMTWAKTLAGWFADPAEGLSVLEALNHRYALDGRDPSSYGGILWAYGMFDRPQGDPQRGRLGLVGDRSGAAHLARVGAARFSAKVAGGGMGLKRVAVVGAGVTGCFLAKLLSVYGVSVQLFDAGRRPGGRCATREFDGLRFEHGASSFRVADPRVLRWVRSWADAGVLREDRGRWVGAPTLSSLINALLDGQSVLRSHLVTRLTRAADGWEIADARGAPMGGFDRVVLTQPVHQLVALAEASGLAVPAALREVRYDAAWSVLVEGEALPADDDPWVEARWLSTGGNTAVLRLSAMAQAIAAEQSRDEFLATLDDRYPGLVIHDSHSWKSATAVDATRLAGPVPLDAAGEVWAAGDAFSQGCEGVESAMLSAMAVVGALLGADAERDPAAMA